MENERLNSLWSLIAGSEVLCVRSSASGKEIAVGTNTSCLALDSHTGKQIFTTGESSGRVTSVAFTSEGRLLVGGQGRLQLWDVQSSMVLASLNLRIDVEEADLGLESVYIAPRSDGQLFGVASELGRCPLEFCSFPKCNLLAFEGIPGATIGSHATIAKFGTSCHLKLVYLCQVFLLELADILNSGMQ